MYIIHKHIYTHTYICICGKNIYVYVCMCDLPAYTYTHMHVQRLGWVSEVPAAYIGGIPPTQHHLRFIFFWSRSCGFVFQDGLPTSGIPGTKKVGLPSVSSKLCALLLSEWLRLISLLEEEMNAKRRAFSLCDSLSPLSSTGLHLPALHPSKDQPQSSVRICFALRSLIP